MARFEYKAVSASGDVIEGEMDAQDQAGAIEQIHALGHVPIRADEVGAGSPRRRSGLEALIGRKVSRHDVAIFTRELAILLTAGLPLERALEIVTDVSDRESVQRLVKRLLESVRGGTSLADAMATQQNIFSRTYISTVHAGEVGAALDVVLVRLADFMEKSQQLRETVKSALIYPVILLVMTGLSIVVLLTVVLPEFKPLFEDAGAALPLSAAVLINFGDALQQYGLLIVLGAIILFVPFRRSLRTPRSRIRWDRWLLHAPLVGDLVTKVEVARFSRTMGTLLGNGVELLTAISVAQESIGNTAIARAIDQLIPSLKEGRGMSAPLIEAAVFPRLAAHLIRVGEESGQLEEMMVKVADIFDREVQLSVDRMMAVLVPALTIVLGLLVAGIILTILSAIMSVYDLPF
ncbi:MAG: type II secretion system F family protein [Alphaproteobacteria bacterium]